jgi:hypothetical protein
MALSGDAVNRRTGSQIRAERSVSLRLRQEEQAARRRWEWLFPVRFANFATFACLGEYL